MKYTERCLNDFNARGYRRRPRPAAPTARRGCARLGKTGPLSQGVQAGRKALRIRHIHGMEVRKKRPGEFK
jgi:hypothetical protein